MAFESVATNLVAGDTNGRFDVFVHNRANARTTRISVGPSGQQGRRSSGGQSISPGGRFVAFGSLANNLVPGDTNGLGDIFVRDRQAGTTTWESVGPGGGQGNGESNSPSISGGGRFIAFTSLASNLVPGDTNVADDIFVRDRQAGTTTRVSVGTGGQEANNSSFSPSISDGGRFVAFDTSASNLVPGDTDGFADVFVRDRQAGTTTRVSVGPNGRQANSHSGGPSISSGGRFVAFDSAATNLVPGDTNGFGDVFVRDRVAGTTMSNSPQH